MMAELIAIDLTYKIPFQVIINSALWKVCHLLIQASTELPVHEELSEESCGHILSKSP